MKKITLLIAALLGGLTMQAQYASMAIVGDGAGGWPPDNQPAEYTDPHQMTSDDGVHWTYDNLVLGVGSVKFRALNHWTPTDNWGGNSFPSGTGIVDGPGITSVVGVFDVTFNSTTLEYSFIQQNLYPTISLVGPGVGGPDVWNVDVDLSTTDGVVYTGTGIAINGGVKFRQNHDWLQGNWAPPTFPSGTAIFDDPGALDVPEGTYNVMFNKTTLAYSFTFPSIALVGSATPQGWPNDPQVDQHVLSTTNGVDYVLNSITLVAGAGKFRQDNAWTVQWGRSTDPGFPSGTGTQTGQDINITAGTYSLHINRVTGVYSFEEPITAAETFGKDSFMVFPNPTQNSWTFNSVNSTITAIEVVDITGKTVFTATPNTQVTMVDASGLSNGIYLARVESNGAIKTVKLVKN